VDPKSIVCEFFKQGRCRKGARCKFSHDLSQERKAEKINIYEDRRDLDENETMENWDEDQLRSVVDKKKGNNQAGLSTDIVCKHFLDAIEEKKIWLVLGMSQRR